MYDRTLRKFDSRIVERNLARKVVSRDEYQAHLDALEDCAHLADESDIDFIASNRSSSDKQNK
jgi:hypothetical protein